MAHLGSDTERLRVFVILVVFIIADVLFVILDNDIEIVIVVVILFADAVAAAAAQI